MATSEVARFKAEQENAARLGLSGPAIVSQHTFSEQRAERGAQRIFQLLAQGQYEGAKAQMDAPN